MNSIIFIRLDKIGDLVATLPMDQASFLNLQKQNEKHSPPQIKWVLAKGLGVIANHAMPKRNFIEIENSKSFKLENFRMLYNFLKNEKPDAVIVFYAPWWVGLACWLAGIPRRIGRISQWHSFIFFNRGLRQKRTLAEKHEADYNRELVEFGLGDLIKYDQNLSPVLKLDIAANLTLLQSYNLIENKYLVIHPGMFGSALNWPQMRYNELISILIEAPYNYKIAITGTTSDERFLTEIKSKWSQDERIIFLQNKLNMTELLAILKSAKAVIAPSTGVLHLAAALGKSTLGIYSPILVHHPRRWGPRSSSNNARFLLPPVACPATQNCLGTSCQYYPCMEKITVQEVVLRVLE